MVGTILAAGSGKLDQRNVYEMLTIPSKKSWNIKIPSAPSCGLYLTNVEYPPEVLAKHTRTFDQIIEVDKLTENEPNSGDEDVKFGKKKLHKTKTVETQFS